MTSSRHSREAFTTHGGLPAHEATVIIRRPPRRLPVIATSLIATLGLVLGVMLYLETTAEHSDAAPGTLTVMRGDTNEPAAPGTGVADIARGAGHQLDTERASDAPTPPGALAGTAEAAGTRSAGNAVPPPAGDEPARPSTGVETSGIQASGAQRLAARPPAGGTRPGAGKAGAPRDDSSTSALEAAMVAAVSPRAPGAGSAAEPADGERGAALQPRDGERIDTAARTGDGQARDDLRSRTAGNAGEDDASAGSAKLDRRQTTALPTGRATAPEPKDVRVPRKMAGDAGRGKGLFDRCQSCHGKSASPLAPSRYTQKQWIRYLASSRHNQHAPLGEHFTLAQLADIKTYLIENAIDVSQNRTPGIR